MTTVQSSVTVDTSGPVVRGQKVHRSNQTLSRIIGRAIDLDFLTLLFQRASDLKWGPLDDVNPARTFAKMVCGAIGGTGPAFAANSDAEFSITVDGQVLDITGLDMTGLDTVADTPGYMTCGAIGATLPELAAVSDGQFGIGFDGNAAINVVADFSGIDAIDDTPGYWTCGANGTNIAGYVALTDAAFSYVVDGVAGDTGAMNLTTCVTFADVVQKINFHLNGEATMLYGWNTDVFKLVSNKTGETSSVTIGAPAAGTDISAAGFLNQVAGSATAGTGGENLGQTPTSIINAELVGRGLCFFDGDAFVFISRTAGETSAVSVLTAGAGGTDISGAAFLNGLSGTGTPTAGTGGEALFETITGIINAAAAGRFTCYFDGNAFVFISPNSGLPQSSITVLSAVSGGAGTDISGASFLNGLSATGTVTAATGGDGENIPAGLYWGIDIPFATIAAADVDEQNVLIGKTVELDESKIVLEGSLTLDSIVVETGKTIRKHLSDIGIFARSTEYFQNIQPIA